MGRDFTLTIQPRSAKFGLYSCPSVIHFCWPDVCSRRVATCSHFMDERYECVLIIRVYKDKAGLEWPLGCQEVQVPQAWIGAEGARKLRFHRPGVALRVPGS